MTSQLPDADGVFPKNMHLEISPDGRQVIRVGEENLLTDATAVVEVEDASSQSPKLKARWVDLGDPYATFCTSDFARLKAGQDYVFPFVIDNGAGDLEKLGSIYTRFIEVNSLGVARFNVEGMVFYNLEEPTKPSANT